MESPRGPARIGPYRIIDTLGSGGMGRVVLAEGDDGRRVAVKLVRDALADEEQFRVRFRREIDAARQVSGRRTARVLDADPDANPPWMAVEFVAGPTLQRLVGGSGPLPTAQTRELAANMAEALADIHAAGVIHRDLKPSNVLIDDDGGRVIDFGVARAIDATGLTGTGFVTGSASYMSPEQAKAESTGPSSDVFSLGAVLYFAATGQPPFGIGPAPGIMYRLVHEPADLAAVEDPSLRALIDACLAKDPEQRPTPARIQAWHQGDPLPAVPSNDTEETMVRQGVPSRSTPGSADRASWGSGRRLAALTASSLLVLAFVLTGWTLASRDSRSSDQVTLSADPARTTPAPTTSDATRSSPPPTAATATTTPAPVPATTTRPAPANVAAPAPQPAARAASTAATGPTSPPTPAPAAAPTLELNRAVAADPPEGLLCSSTAGAIACFQQFGDVFWVKDSLADGHSAIADWEDLTSTSGPIYRRGRCINALGNGTWAKCNKDLGETTVVRFTAKVFDTVTQELFSTGPTRTLGAN